MYLYKAEQTAEAPWHSIEPLWSRVRPLWVHQLSQVTVSEVTVSTVGGKVLLCDVACGEVADAQEVTSASDVTFLVRAESRQARATQALLGTLPNCRNKTENADEIRICKWSPAPTKKADTFLFFYLFAVCLTYIVFHNLRIVSIKEWCGKPSQVELNISFSGFYISLIGDIHWFSPVCWQGDAHHTWNGRNTYTSLDLCTLTGYKLNSVSEICLPFCLFRHWASYVCQTLAWACQCSKW